MHLAKLKISNFRAIRTLQIEVTQKMVVIAGPNGCGKSSIFDAIRLLKSCYGAHQMNEMQQWFGEFSISPNSTLSANKNLFRDQGQPIQISASFALSARERDFLRTERVRLAGYLAKQLFAGGQMTPMAIMRAQALEARATGDAIADHTIAIANEIAAQLELSHLDTEVVIPTAGEHQTTRNALVELMFSYYDPRHLGIIDYYSAHRTYQREAFGGVNLQIDSDGERRKQSLLYNTHAKYTNIKSEMAGTFVRDLITRMAGGAAFQNTSLVETLKELFRTFFPGKSFEGPVARVDGSLDFPVKVGDELRHDLNELSSGEKELLFGYLRLRNDSPQDSLILLDEPEAHLNPGMLRGLASFYRRHLCDHLNSQIWMMTHSDALIREAIVDSAIAVYHMRPASPDSIESQLSRISASDALERAVLDLSGNLASYKPGGKVVIFEGEDSDFDERLVAALFPELARTANLLSAGTKAKVAALYDLLARASSEGKLPAQFFAVVDSDAAPSNGQLVGAQLHKWPVYHVENFLLNAEFVFAALRELDPACGVYENASAVEIEIRAAALTASAELRRILMEEHLNKLVLGCIKLNANRTAPSTVPSLSSALAASRRRLDAAVASVLSDEELAAKEKEIDETIAQAFATDEWRARIPGRIVLGALVDSANRKKFAQRLDYKLLRNLVVARMVQVGHQPLAMKTIVASILEA